MFERIVIGLDGSDTAELALPAAEELARKFGATLLLVTAAHTLQDLAATAPSLASQAATSQDVVARSESAGEQATARAYLHALKQRLADDGVKSETRVRQGAPADQILKAAADFNAGLIVLTAYGAGGAHTRNPGAVFGGIADEVLRQSRVPVLLIRP